MSYDMLNPYLHSRRDGTRMVRAALRPLVSDRRPVRCSPIALGEGDDPSAILRTHNHDSGGVLVMGSG
jgi:hypothetical protein